MSNDLASRANPKQTPGSFIKQKTEEKFGQMHHYEYADKLNIRRHLIGDLFSDRRLISQKEIHRVMRALELDDDDRIKVVALVKSTFDEEIQPHPPNPLEATSLGELLTFKFYSSEFNTRSELTHPVQTSEDTINAIFNSSPQKPITQLMIGPLGKIAQLLNFSSQEYDLANTFLEAMGRPAISKTPHRVDAASIELAPPIQQPNSAQK